MSIGALKGRTAQFGFGLIRADWPSWADEEHKNWQTVEGILASVGALALKGPWENNTAYIAGDRVVDTSNGQLFLCEVDHTSAASGTFSIDRTANPSYWNLISSVPIYRGVWAPSTLYDVGDIVQQDTYNYYFCLSKHTSGATFAPDIANWTTIVLGKPIVDDATTAKNAAEVAELGAQSAQSAAESARDSASGHRLNAQNAQTAAEAARDLALTYRNTAEGHKNDAEAAAIASGISETAADNHRIEAASSATSALSSANAAAASAASIDPDTLLTKVGNLSGLSNLTTARNNLGLGSAAVQAASLDILTRIAITSVAAIDFTLFVDASKYDLYEFVFRDVRLATVGSALLARFSDDNGATFNTASSYRWAYGGLALRTTTPTLADQGSDSATSITVAPNVDRYVSGILTLKMGSAAPILAGTLAYVSGGGTPAYLDVRSAGTHVAISNPNAIRFLPSAGNFSAEGSIAIYGRRLI
jgi:hypothetical protein